jgi:hypothetical protein
MSITMCGNPYAKVREEFSEHRIIISDFLTFMREQSRRKVAKKEEGLFNLCVFNPPEGAEDYRTLEHFQSASGLVLDFDNGEMSPQEFERIFWSEAGRGRKLSFVLMNTFSRRADRPNKFRVLIPFRRPAKSVEEFHAAYDYILRRIEERGCRKPPRISDGPDLDAGGLDRSSRSPTQIFYWPCTNAAHRPPICMAMRHNRASAKRLVAVSIADACTHEKARPWNEAGLSSFPQDQRAPAPIRSDQYLARTGAGGNQFK